MAEREASGDFDYVFDDQTEIDESPDQDLWDEPDEAVWNDGFDAFDSSTWYFEPAPTPWYRTKPAMTAMLAASAAAMAIVVSGVLLVFRGPSATGDETAPMIPTPPATTDASTRPATSAPPPPPAPPPAEISAEPIDPVPVQTYRPRSPSRTTKEPEINVTRTPETRSPISVAPRRPIGQRE